MKKQLISLLLAVVLITLSYPFVVFSASVALDSASFNKETATLNFSGTVAGCRDEYVYVSVTQTNSGGLNLSDLNQGKQIFTTVKLESNNTFSSKIIMPESFPGGNFVLKVICDGEVDTYHFSYISMNTLNTIASLLTPGMDSLAVENVIDDYLNELLIENLYWTNIKSTVCPIVSSLNKSGYTGESFYNTLTHATGVYELKNGAALSEVFSVYLAEILNYTTDFLSLSPAVQTGVESDLRIADFTKADFKTTYFNIVAVHTVKNSADYTVLQNYIVTNSSLLGIDLSTYNSKTDYAKDNIMKTMFASLSEISLFNDIKTKFDLAVANTLSQSAGGSSTPPGGGSSAPSSRPSGSVSFSPGASSTPSPAPIVPQPSKLNDIDNHWAKNAINTLVSKDVISGYTDGSFRPENNVTRAEFAKMVSVLLKGDYSVTAEFTDVNSDQWHYSYITRLASAGIINGFNGEFKPNGLITREDAAVIIGRFLSVNGHTVSGNVEFSDNADVSEYAKESVAFLAEIGVIKGYENRFNPKVNLTRAEAATILFGILDKIN